MVLATDLCLLLACMCILRNRGGSDSPIKIDNHHLCTLYVAITVSSMDNLDSYIWVALTRERRITM